MDNNRETKEFEEPMEQEIEQEQDLKGWTEHSEEGRSERADYLRCGDPLIQEEEESG